MLCSFELNEHWMFRRRIFSMVWIQWKNNLNSFKVNLYQVWELNSILNSIARANGIWIHSLLNWMCYFMGMNRRIVRWWKCRCMCVISLDHCFQIVVLFLLSSYWILFVSSHIRRNRDRAQNKCEQVFQFWVGYQRERSP